ncbi:MAG: hypothetical protein Q9P14_08520 [candidate division KSB1 bacterium]|nr:hypothetical protein [candidate division KSB1 bacterium]
MVYDLSTHLKFRLTGSFSNDLRRGGFANFRQALSNIFWKRERLYRTNRAMLSLKATHLLSPKTFLRGQSELVDAVVQVVRPGVWR